MIVGWFLVGWLCALGCDAPLRTRPSDDVLTDVPEDVTPDADADVAVDVAPDVVDPCPREPWWEEDPFEVAVFPGPVTSMAMLYPYIYFQLSQWDNELQRRNAWLFEYDVETQDATLVATHHFTPQREFMIVDEASRSLYWVGVDAVLSGQDFPEYTLTYFMMRYSMDDRTLEVVPTPRFVTDACETWSGHLRLLGYDSATGNLVLQCEYVEYPWQKRTESYRFVAASGEVQYIVNGAERYGAIFNPDGLAPGFFVAQTGAWTNYGGDDFSEGPPLKYEVWDNHGEAPTLVYEQEMAPRTMGFPSPLNLDGWFTYTTLSADETRVVARGVNIHSHEEMILPEVCYNQYFMRNVSSSLPNLWTWNDAGEGVTYLYPYIMPSGPRNIELWDSERNIVRRVTNSPAIITALGMLPGEPIPRTLVYYTSDSHGENQRIFMKDLIAAGMLDETGHLLPAP
ncbi:MAG: hypothetical protein CVU65_10530 [Deltaproteobacteria bacterium HGW-Deltaproteobacteria-22]|nr:MAG: hypothetical protein CVU65_10530 [Deltaproteobacteria bacterium HGW-Deltaproteobacteria-22]